MITPSQQIMVDDGCPLSLFDPKEPWTPKPAAPSTLFISKAKTEDAAAAEKLLAELEEQKLVKSKKKSLPAVDRTGQRWDSRRNKWINENELFRKPQPMISITTNTRGATKMAVAAAKISKAYKDMSMSELVEIYNKSSGKPPIKKFETRTFGLKRLEALEIAGAIKEVKAAVESKPKAKAGATEKTGILAEFKFRDDSPREKLLLALKEEMGKQVPLEKLASAVFGSKSTDNIQKVLVTWNGITWRIEMFKLPYIATKTKTDLGLAKKK